MSNPQPIVLFTAQAANGNSAIAKTVERGGKVETEPVAIQVDGTWQTGSTVKPQISLDGGTTYTNITKFNDAGTQVELVLTENGAFDLNIPSLAKFRLNLSGVATAPSINAWALGNIVLSS